LVPDSDVAQQTNQPHDRQAHHGEVVALDPLDDRGTIALNPVRSGLVHRLPGGDVSFDLVVPQTPKPHPHFLYGRAELPSARNGDGGGDHVLASAQQRKHPRGVFLVPGLAQDFAVYDDDSVRSNRDQIGIPFRDRARLLPRQPFGVTAAAERLDGIGFDAEFRSQA